MANRSRDRAQRIELDYYRATTPVQRLRNWLSLAAVVAAVAWLASGFALGDRGRLRYSRGPLAHVHATWDTQCEACHTPFHPEGSAAALADLVDVSLNDQKCQACHAALAHSPLEIAGEVESCAACHRDHRGRESSLLAVTDNHCTRCHTSIAAHRSIEAASPNDDVRPDRPIDPPLANVESFATVDRGAVDAGHPEFRAVERKDPRTGLPTGDGGRIKFNHALHMSLGMPLALSNKLPASDAAHAPEPWFTVDHIDPADRDRYRSIEPASSAGSRAFVQLECADCHRLDASSASAPHSSLAADTTGAYMLPITYENDCRACHPLSFDRALSSEDDRPVTVPHGIQPADVRQLLRQTYAADLLADQPELLDLGVHRPRAMPGRDVDAWSWIADLPIEQRQRAQQQLDDRVMTAGKLLFIEQARAEQKLLMHNRGCSQCHVYQQGDDTQAIVEPSQLDAELQRWFLSDDRTELRVAPAEIPLIWFGGARFDHAAHRAISCRECHAAAYGDGAEGHGASRETRDVLLPSVETCAGCHSPRRTEGGVALGGASTGCVECHRYHGDALHDDASPRLGPRFAPTAGHGAPPSGAHGEARLWLVEEFLRGGRPNAATDAPTGSTKASP